MTGDQGNYSYLRVEQSYTLVLLGLSNSTYCVTNPHGMNVELLGTP